MALVFSHPGFAGHVTPPGHPERVDRLRAVEAGLVGLSVERREAVLADLDDVTRCHPRAYADRVAAAVPSAGWAQLDGDTWLSPGSLDAALRAVGGAGAAVDAVLTGVADRAFVACRPPGHHAEAETAMGFCLFGTVAIAAKRALDVHGLSRVAIVDFDVHHGNGTQDIFYDDANVFYVSLHQWPLYPGTGRPDERGAVHEHEQEGQRVKRCMHQSRPPSLGFAVGHPVVLDDVVAEEVAEELGHGRNSGSSGMSMPSR